MKRTRLKQSKRDRRLTTEEASQYAQIRKQIEAEKPHIQSRIRSKVAIQEAFAELKRIRMSQGKSLADMRDLTGMDRSALSKLETGKRENPSIDTLVRYADALGKRLVVEIADESDS